MHPTDSWEHTVLRPRGGHDSISGNGTIAMEQTKATQKTKKWSIQLLDYLASNQDAKVRFHASDMVMNIHSDASYLSESGARSQACGHFFMGWMPKTGNQ